MLLFQVRNSVSLCNTILIVGNNDLVFLFQFSIVSLELIRFFEVDKDALLKLTHQQRNGSPIPEAIEKTGPVAVFEISTLIELSVPFRSAPMHKLGTQFISPRCEFVNQILGGLDALIVVLDLVHGLKLNTSSFGSIKTLFVVAFDFQKAGAFEVLLQFSQMGVRDFRNQIASHFLADTIKVFFKSLYVELILHSFLVEPLLLLFQKSAAVNTRIQIVSDPKHRSLTRIAELRLSVIWTVDSSSISLIEKDCRIESSCRRVELPGGGQSIFRRRGRPCPFSGPHRFPGTYGKHARVRDE